MAHLETLGEQECWDLVASRTVGRLVVSIDNRPDIFPVNYRLDDQTIVIKTAAGLKLAAAVLGRGVAFEVDMIDEVHHGGWSVVVHGTAYEIEQVDELLAAEELNVEPWAEGEKARYLRVSSESITGRRIPATG